MSTSSTDGRPVQPVPLVEPPGFAEPPGDGTLTAYAGQALEWYDCADDLDCAQLLAPLDYADPGGQAITLLVAKAPASGASRGTLFVNPGGPGGSGVDMAAAYAGAAGFDDVDLVGWDPRGAGRSTPARCFGGAELDRFYDVDVSPDSGSEQDQLIAASRAFAASCLARSGRLLEHISTSETVRDLELLRTVLGVDRIDYVGASYGTLIGALYATQYPDRVGRMVLDGPVDLADGPVEQASGFERALGNFADWCASTDCGLGESRGAVLKAIEQVLTGLDQQPLPGSDDRILSQQLGVQGTIFPLYGGRDGWARLAPALVQARKGDGTLLMAQADYSNSRDEAGRFGQFAYAFPAIRCLDSQTTTVAETLDEAAEATEQAPLIGPLFGPDVLCAQWPVAPAPEPPKPTAAGAPTILVIGTTGDPATPYAWAQAAVRQLDGAVLLTYRGEGHTAFGRNDCVNDAVFGFLSGGSVPADGTRC